MPATPIKNSFLTIGGLAVLFNPEDNRIYGGGWGELYCLGEGKIEGEVFKPIFPKGTKFTFRLMGRIEITDAPGYYITINLPSTLKEIKKEELTKPSLAEILEEETRVKD